MSLYSTLHGIADLVLRAPVVHNIAANQERQTFLRNRDRNLFYGVYPSWSDAAQAAADCGDAGYDNAASSELYLNRVRMDQHDYPALYWISRSLRDGMRSILDVGGATGIKYYAFSDELRHWPDTVWTVYDVTAMVLKGRQVAAETPRRPELRFTDNFRDGDGVDLLYASGVLQYLPAPLDEMLAGYRSLPRRIVINTAAIHPTESYFTVNSIGTAFCPYRVQTQASLVRSLSKLGYKLRENWSNPDKPLIIPGRTDLSLRNYSGFVFDLQAQSPSK